MKLSLDRVVRWLPRHQLSLAMNYAAATGVMAAAILLEQLLVHFARLPGLSILLMANLICAIFFNRGASLYTAAISIAAAAFALWQLDLDVPISTGLFIFVAVTLLIVGFGTLLRLAYERATSSERHAELLLKELQHRTHNTLTVMISIIELQAREAANPEVQQALRAAATRIRIQSKAHRHLDLDSAGTVDAHDYVAEVCRLVEASLSGVRPITVHCHAQHTTLGGQKALAIGLVANELITNAVKYAFADGEPGTISVHLERLADGYVQLRVIDDGRGWTGGDVDGIGTNGMGTNGMGTKLIRAFTKEHKGTYERRPLAKGSESIVTFAPRRNWSGV
ncbi:MAG: sensor histidine kinase [Pseudolabrys sp.]|nr:sensor histidine kinase [Pseudolabrys sp.]MDP2298596.1 sensor histidine kinase [Pseudolabrys sp.]